MSASSLVHPRIFLGIAREDHREFVMNGDVSFIHAADRQLEQTFLQDAEEDIIGLRARPVELVVDHGETVLARARETVVDPGLREVLLGFDHRVNEIVHDARRAEAKLAADQVGAAELVVAVDQQHWPAELCRDVHRQGGFAGPRRPAEVDRIPGLEIREGPVRQALDDGGLDKVGLLLQRQYGQVVVIHGRHVSSCSTIDC